MQLTLSALPSDPPAPPAVPALGINASPAGATPNPGGAFDTVLADASVTAGPVNPSPGNAMPATAANSAAPNMGPQGALGTDAVNTGMRQPAADAFGVAVLFSPTGSAIAGGPWGVGGQVRRGAVPDLNPVGASDPDVSAAADGSETTGSGGRNGAVQQGDLQSLVVALLQGGLATPANVAAPNAEPVSDQKTDVLSTSGADGAVQRGYSFGGARLSGANLQVDTGNGAGAGLSTRTAVASAALGQLSASGTTVTTSTFSLVSSPAVTGPSTATVPSPAGTLGPSVPTGNGSLAPGYTSMTAANLSSAAAAAAAPATAGESHCATGPQANAMLSWATTGRTDPVGTPLPQQNATPSANTPTSPVDRAIVDPAHARVTGGPETTASTTLGSAGSPSDRTAVWADPQKGSSIPIPTALPPSPQSAASAVAPAAVALPPEKIAAIAAQFTVASKSLAPGDIKSVVSSQSKGVVKTGAGLGISAAETAPTMPAGSSLDHPTLPVPAVAHAMSATADAKSDPAALPQQVSLPSTAHRAVEAVLNATERFAARDQNSVNLQFTVGGSDLNVRVEMRSGEVHTTFRTDSAELRTALSNEWQSVTSQSSGDRSIRLAAPVFTSSTGTGTSTSGDGTQRQAQQQPDARPLFPATSSASRTSFATTSAPSSTSVPRTSSANSVHLHTLA